MASKKASEPISKIAYNEKKHIMCPVSSPCLNCGSTLRIYDKESRKTFCFDCGKKQSHPHNLAIILYERQYQKLKNASFEDGEPCPVCNLRGEILFESGLRVCLYCNKTKSNEPTAQTSEKASGKICRFCGNDTVKLSSKDEALFECAKCGKSVE